MLVVSASTALALYFAERNLAAAAERDLQREFHGELAAMHHVQEIRHAALVERCGGRVLVIEGDELAFKVTTSVDLDRAGRILGS